MIIIGISGNNKKGKSKCNEFFKQNYSIFVYLDVDKLLFDILSRDDFKQRIIQNDWQDDSLFLLQIKNAVDVELERIFQNIKDNEIVVVDYSMIGNSYLFDKVDIMINSKCVISEDIVNDFDLYRVIQSKLFDKDTNKSKYHLEIDFSESNWEQKLKEYIDYNIFGKAKVTVVVPVYNTIEYLPKCVHSITHQTYRNLEILLINDGSTDESLRMCEYLAKQDKRIKVINQNNVGLAETRNKGIDMASGEYICFIDSDDYIEPQMIESLLKTAQNTKADVCECSFYIHMKDGNIKDVSCEQKGVKLVEGKYDLVNAYSDATILIPAWDKIYKLSAIRDIKFDKECFKEDSDYIFRLCILEKSFALVNVPYYHYVKRKSASITGNKISPQLFTLQDWGEDAYNLVLSQGEEYRDSAEKILYNSLVHILRYFMRDYKNNVLEENEFQNEIQAVVNKIIHLLLHSKNVGKFRKVNEVLSIINELIDDKIISKDLMPTIEIPCIAILWNSLNQEMMNEAISFLSEKSSITSVFAVDLQDQYRQFIYDIYEYNKEFEGIPIMKAGCLIDRYDSNTIVVLNLMIRVSNYMYYNGTKGFMFEEIARLKFFIRKFFKTKIQEYAFDNIFHLTVDDEEYQYTDDVCRKYIKGYRGNKQDEK